MSSLISDRLWDQWFGRDSAVIGRSYFVSGEMRQVIGIMPPEFRFPSDETLLWVAGEARLEPGTARQPRPAPRGAHEAGSNARAARHRVDPPRQEPA